MIYDKHFWVPWMVFKWDAFFRRTRDGPHHFSIFASAEWSPHNHFCIVHEEFLPPPGFVMKNGATLVIGDVGVVHVVLRDCPSPMDFLQQWLTPRFARHGVPLWKYVAGNADNVRKHIPCLPKSTCWKVSVPTCIWMFFHRILCWFFPVVFLA